MEVVNLVKLLASEVIPGLFRLYILKILHFARNGVNWKEGRCVFIKQFIYLDTDIVNSIIAQSEKGLVLELSSEYAESNTDAKKKEDTIGAKASIGGSFLRFVKAEADFSVGGKIESDNQAYSASKEIATKTLHDAAFDYAYNNIKAEVTEPDIAEIGSYIELSRAFDFVDFEYVLGLFSENGFVDLLKSNSSANNVQLDQIKSIVNAIKSIIPYNRMLISYDGFVIPFEDKYFRVNPKTIGFKYGGEITCIGLITNIIGEDTSPCDSNVFTNIQFQINEALRKILPTKEKNLYIVHPIAIYYGK